MYIQKDYLIISKDYNLQPAIDHIESSEYLAFDTETTGLNVRKDTVIGMSFSGKEGKAFYIARYTWDCEKQELVQAVSDKNFISVLRKIAEKELLMWNASYDTRIVYSNFGIDLKAPLLADIMIMKHTIQEEGEFSLKKVAVQFQDKIGIDVEKEANEEQIILKENVAKNGGSTTKSNFEMYKADLEVMGKYAAADADLTLRLSHLFYKMLDEEGLEKYFFEVEPMPLYKHVTITMEEKGVELDMNLLLSTKKQIEKDIELLKKKVIDKLMINENVLNWYNDYINKKFPASNKGSFAQAVVDFYNIKDVKKTKSGKYRLTAKTIPAIECDTFIKDFLLGNSPLPDDDVKSIQSQLHIDKEGYPINISSKKQLGEIVFDYLGFKPLTKTNKGAPQFNDSMIRHLASKGIDWANDLSNYNKLIKIKGAYIDRFIDGQEDGIYYPSFFQHRTISGRYGSDLQQLNRPKEEGELDSIVLKYNNLIRKFFIAGKGRKFIDSDYESLEPHVFCHVSCDDRLKDIFRKGHDFYSTIAIRTEGLKGVSADKKADNYLGKVNKPLRQKAKVYSLGLPYGLSAYALGKTLDIPTEDAQVLVDNYLNGFPDLKKWMEDTDKAVIEKGYVVSEVGRIRHLEKARNLHKLHGNKLLDFKYRKKLEKKFKKEEVLNMYRDYKNAFNNAKNFQIQSLSASIVNLAAIQINKELKNRGIDGWVALQIHDQLVVNVPEEKAKECQGLVQEIMENSYKLSIDLKAPAEIADNLYDGH